MEDEVLLLHFQMARVSAVRAAGGIGLEPKRVSPVGGSWPWSRNTSGLISSPRSRCELRSGGARRHRSAFRRGDWHWTYEHPVVARGDSRPTCSGPEIDRLSRSLDAIVQSWDTANKESELADYSVCTTWGVKGKKSYLLHVLRKRMAYPDLKRTVIAQAEAWKARSILIEDKASGIQLVQELRDILSGIKGIKCEGDKIMRMLAQTPEIENGHVLLPKQASWLPDYVQELTTFPKGKYDDQVDSTAQALKWITVEGREPAIITFYKQLIAKERGLTMDEVENQLQAGRPA